MKTRSSDSRSGQMLVVVMLMITTVIIMFGMTVSVGHLVQSRINLQNSVDLATMSAASYQARYLNSMSIVNYRTRAILRHFLMDAYVTQTRFNKNFQQQVLAGGSGTISNPLTTLSVCQQARGYSPSSAIGETGRPSDDSENVCQNLEDSPKTITPLIPSPIPGFNPIFIFINIALLKIAQEFADACNDWRGQNGVWADFFLNRAQKNTKDQSDQVNTVISAFATAMNSNPNLGSTELADTGRGDAGLTAISTFGANLIGAHAPENLALYYLGNQSHRILGPGDLQTSKKLMGLSYVDPEFSGGCTIKINSGGANATAREITQGFSKSGSGGGKQVNLGLLGNSPAVSILFWPQGLEPAMVAVSAAKPFGSRVGPPASYFQAEGGNGYGNMALKPGDDGSLLENGGLGNIDILRAAFQRLPDPGNGQRAARPVDELAGFAFTPTIFDGLYFSYFPPGSIYSPSGDVLPGLSFNGVMPDRGGRVSDPGPMTAAGGAGLPYYSEAALKSAWTPNGASPRSGFQIKMISIEQLCATSTEPFVQGLCDTGEASL